PTFFVDSFKVTPIIAGYCTAACVFTGSLLRPMGGALADRFGGIRTLTFVYLIAAALLAVISVASTSGLAVAVALFVAA
ncbi:MFS transporter, partial [Streptomyces scabiei]